MSSSQMCHRAALIKIDVSQKRIASIIMVTIFFSSVLALLVTVNVFPSSVIFAFDDRGYTFLRNGGCYMSCTA
jgi:hypothetical protein